MQQITFPATLITITVALRYNLGLGGSFTDLHVMMNHDPHFPAQWFIPAIDLINNRDEITIDPIHSKMDIHELFDKCDLSKSIMKPFVSYIHSVQAKVFENAEEWARDMREVVAVLNPGELIFE